MQINKIIQETNFDHGFEGLPSDFPKPPPSEDLMFYIQRNQNYNTVVYELNKQSSSGISQEYPLHPYWIQYTEGGEIKELNTIQNELAYGYEVKKIQHDTFQFNFVSYKEFKLFLAKDGKGKFKTFCDINGKLCVLNNIYVYADELGVFPKVKFIELYGYDNDTKESAYEKMNIDL